LYDVHIAENVSVGAHVAHITTVDNDRTIGFPLSNHVRRSTRTFWRALKNGTVVLMRELDRETRDRYVLTVTVYDGDPDRPNSMNIISRTCARWSSL
ncbi:unnamed protein product, partial [Sphagnum balticum]